MLSPNGSRKLTCANPCAPVEETTGPHRGDNNKKNEQSRSCLFEQQTKGP